MRSGAWTLPVITFPGRARQVPLAIWRVPGARWSHPAAARLGTLTRVRRTHAPRDRLVRLSALVRAVVHLCSQLRVLGSLTEPFALHRPRIRSAMPIRDRRLAQARPPREWE